MAAARKILLFSRAIATSEVALFLVNFFVNEPTEGILNGGFEDQYNGYPGIANHWYGDIRTDAEHHTGGYCCKVWKSATNGMYTMSTYQTLSTPIKGEDVLSFGFWAKTDADKLYSQVCCAITYSDTTFVDIVKDLTDDWQYFDILAEIDPNKEITIVGFSAVTASPPPVPYDIVAYVDDVSLICQLPTSKIILNGVSYADGESDNLPSGTFSLSADIDTGAGHVFDHWASSGGITIADPSSQNTTATITGAGSITLYTSLA